MKRREFIKSFGKSLVLAPLGVSLLDSCHSTTSPTTLRGSQPLRIPSSMGSGTLTATSDNTTLWNGISSPAFLLNGNIPGPTITVRKGDSFYLQYINQLAEISNLHWHGISSPPLMDGHPKYAAQPGMSLSYSFPILDRAGTYWYHAHPDRLTGKQAYMGIAGAFVVHDDVEDALSLPRGEFDIPLLISDKRLNDKGEMIYTPDEEDTLIGYLGDTNFVNITPNAYHEVSTTLYRVRIINAANARIYNIGFSDARLVALIANDGGLLDKPVMLNSFFLSPGERADLLVDFSKDTLGNSVILKSLPFTFNSTHQNPTYPQGKESDILRFDIKKKSSVTLTIPSSLVPFEQLTESQAVNTRIFPLTMNHSLPYGKHQIDGKIFDIDRVDYQVKLGDIELWEFQNEGDSVHGMHVHGTQFQVAERLFGVGSVQPTDKGWKDTVYIGPNEVVRILVRFNSYKGIYLLHCHNLEHEDDGMMVNVEVV